MQHFKGSVVVFQLSDLPSEIIYGSTQTTVSALGFQIRVHGRNGDFFLCSS